MPECYWSQGQACFGDVDTRTVHEALENRALSQRGRAVQLVQKGQFREARNLLILLNRRLPRWRGQ